MAVYHRQQFFRVFFPPTLTLQICMRALIQNHSPPWSACPRGCTEAVGVLHRFTNAQECRRLPPSPTPPIPFPQPSECMHAHTHTYTQTNQTCLAHSEKCQKNSYSTLKKVPYDSPLGVSHHDCDTAQLNIEGKGEVVAFSACAPHMGHMPSTPDCAWNILAGNDGRGRRGTDGRTDGHRERRQSPRAADRRCSCCEGSSRKWGNGSR